MKTFPIDDEEARCGAFEIENAYVSRHSVAKVLKGIAGVTAVQLRGRVLSADEVRVAFCFMGQPCIVWEPFSDNSRYWIGPEGPEARGPDISPIRTAFDRHEPPFLRRLFWDLLLGRFSR
ncbi:hypothetical protein BJI69_19815 [Luteibacter rhizovicinus DSM 16549]|uniref:Uncharacterized protein n=1 Tax=Luteibacter rhizovicinus DSM 16549 TaxID=1440763 RepID=A0A0G9HD84_9GAMM|nr:hypothetical protein BJI69_19815 [Luteibacter rhizovicinus DSM 16549]KLD67124.1 hypothetical protein Y883_09180 [Luteibacter rhizovicinus DSM 16549]